jgi:hypothetical protein
MVLWYRKRTLRYTSVSIPQNAWRIFLQSKHRRDCRRRNNMYNPDPVTYLLCMTLSLRLRHPRLLYHQVFLSNRSGLPYFAFASRINKTFTVSLPCRTSSSLWPTLCRQVMIDTCVEQVGAKTVADRPSWWSVSGVRYGKAPLGTSYTCIYWSYEVEIANVQRSYGWVATAATFTAW